MSTEVDCHGVWMTNDRGLFLFFVVFYRCRQNEALIEIMCVQSWVGIRSFGAFATENLFQTWPMSIVS
jgi:hypothetical protein